MTILLHAKHLALTTGPYASHNSKTVCRLKGTLSESSVLPSAQTPVSRMVPNTLLSHIYQMIAIQLVARARMHHLLVDIQLSPIWNLVRDSILVLLVELILSTKHTLNQSMTRQSTSIIPQTGTSTCSCNCMVSGPVQMLGCMLKHDKSGVAAFTESVWTLHS